MEIPAPSPPVGLCAGDMLPLGRWFRTAFAPACVAEPQMLLGLTSIAMYLEDEFSRHRHPDHSFNSPKELPLG